MSRYVARLMPLAEPESPEAAAWEALVRACPESGFMQSLHWARFKQQQGLAVRHVALFENDRLAGGALLYSAAQASGAGILVAPEGPVLPWQDPAAVTEGMQAILRTVTREAAGLGAIGLRVEPRVPLPKPSALRNFGRAPLELVPSQTLYLDLADGEEAILAAMHPKGRYNTRLAQRKGVQVVETADPAAVNRFYDVLVEAGQRDDFFIEPPGFFGLLAECLCPAGVARFLFAEHEGETLAAMLLLTYGPRATYLYGGIRNHKRNLMAGYALQWAAIQTAMQQGCTTYDFYGFEALGDPNHLYATFSRFKRQFGGTPVRFIGAQDHYFLGSLADVIVKAVQEIG